MKFIPILFQTEMVQAIQSGRKTMTRRVVNPQPIWNDQQKWWEFPAPGWTGADYAFAFNPNESNYFMDSCPYGRPGDILWVRETYREIEQDFGTSRYEYRANETINLSDKWKPSIFMPKIACRIFLKITNIKVERLHDISEEDSKAEGVKFENLFEQYECASCTGKGHSGAYHMCEDGYYDTAVAAFKSLWVNIKGRQSWESNPWVWVITFEKVQKPECFI